MKIRVFDAGGVFLFALKEPEAGGIDDLPIVTLPAVEPVEIEPTQAAPVPEPAVEQVLQLIPDERGFDAEREPEGVPVEPETPDVVVAIDQSHNTTPITIPDGDITNYRVLAHAVILQAIEDKATEWFFSSYCKHNFEFWCAVGGLDPGQLRKRAMAAVG